MVAWLKLRAVQGAVGLLGVVALGSGAAVATVGPARLVTAGRLFYRLESGRSRDVATDLRRIGRAGRGLGFVQRLLEQRVGSSEGAAALRALAADFPESDEARAVREYEAITGVPYFDGVGCWEKLRRGTRERGAREDLPLDAAIARWRAFCDRYPTFPGRDDAGLRLARCEEEAGRAAEALATLTAALGWGDGDAAHLLRDRIANVLDAQLPLEEALALAADPLVRYSAAVKLARAHRFADAARLEVDPDAIPAEQLALAPPYFVWRDDRGNPVVRREAFRADVLAQRELWAELATAAPADAAERLLGEPHAFANLVLHDHVVTDRGGRSLVALDDGETLDEAFLAYATDRNHLAQAARLFDRAARTSRGEALRRALTGAAVARAGLLGFWGTREGHAVGQPALARLEAAASAAARALDACRTYGELLETRATLAAALAYGGVAPSDDPGVWRTARAVFSTVEAGGPDGSCGPTAATIADAFWARTGELSRAPSSTSTSTSTEGVARGR